MWRHNPYPNNDTLAPSNRGLANLADDEPSLDDEVRKHPPYDPVYCPEGHIDISGASNEGMRDYLKDYCISRGPEISLDKMLEYGATIGPQELPTVMAEFFNEWFLPHTPIDGSHILATNGVSSLLDMVIFNTCDAGEGVLVPVPTYSMYRRDLRSRCRAELIPVVMQQPEKQFLSEHRFEFVEVLEQTYADAVRRHITIKAVLICNPSNPMGRFYSKESLLEIARFCGRRRLHLIADEIFALSGFETSLHLPSFTSVLSIATDRTNGVSSTNIHCLYGCSKDWAMGGLRLGFLVSRNKALWQSCRKQALFTWVTHFSTHFWIEFVKDKENVRRYIETNQKRLTSRYEAVTTLMKEHHIPHVDANGGLFIWIDLRKWLNYFSDRGNVSGGLSGTAARELKLAQHLVKHGVHMSRGKECMSDEPGFFRFVFTSPGDEAFVAVRRIGDACRALESKCGTMRLTIHDSFSLDERVSSEVIEEKAEWENPRSKSRKWSAIRKAAFLLCK